MPRLFSLWRPRRFLGCWLSVADARLGSSLWHQSDFLKFWLSEILSLAALQFGSLTLPLIAIDRFHAVPARWGS